MKRVLFEMLRYGLVGGASTVVDYLVYLTLTRLVGLLELDANIFAYLAGHVVSFFGNRLFTFRSTTAALGSQYWKYWFVSLVGLGISQLVLYLGLMMGWHDLWAKAAAVLLAGLWNYLMHRIWTYRQPVK